MLDDYVSVIMSTRDPLQEHTQAAVQHLQRSTAAYELILLNRNRSWTTGTIVNQGIHASIGDHIVFLCDDCFIEPTALEEMKKVLEDREVGVVGAILKYPDGKVQHAGGKFESRIKDDSVLELRVSHYGKDLELLDSLGTEYDFVTGAFMMTRRDVIEDIGGYDPDCEISWGDVDFCFRAKRAGYKIVLAREAHAVHLEGTTRNSMIFVKQAELRGIKWFLDKWGRTEFVAQLEPGEGVHFFVGAGIKNDDATLTKLGG